MFLKGLCSKIKYSKENTLKVDKLLKIDGQ